MSRVAATFRRLHPGLRIGAVVLVALLLLILEPYTFLFVHVGGLAALGMGALGFLIRGQRVDALLFALPMFALERVEPDAAVQMVICLALPCWLITRRPRFSMVVALASLCMLLVAIHLKRVFAGSILSWQDVRFFFSRLGDNIGVLASQPTLALYSVAFVAVLGLVLAAAWRWDGQPPPATQRAGPLLASVLAVGLVAWSGVALGESVRHIRNLPIWAVVGPSALLSHPITQFLSTASMKPVWEPRTTDTRVFQRGLASAGPAVSAAEAPADVVVFLQESQFNPGTIAGCPPELCRLPLFDPSADTVAQGPMRVHVFGGGTWLTEFAVATGVPHTVFGRSGDFAPFNVAPGVQRSFVRSLRDAGYRTVAVYPVRGGMMNARAAYTGYGFDRFYDSDDLGLDGSFRTSDHLMHDAALRVLQEERQQGKPVLLFVVTIFNHGEHGVSLKQVSSSLQEQARAAFGSATEASNVADYVWRTREFSDAMEKTRHAVLGDSRPAVLAWFGDHQPPFGNALGLRDRIVADPSAQGRLPPVFQTWYQVRTNLPHKGVAAGNAPLDVVFLPGLLAEAAGVPLDDWLAANVVARQQCAGLLMECASPEVRDAYLSYLWSDLAAFRIP